MRRATSTDSLGESPGELDLRQRRRSARWIIASLVVAALAIEAVALSRGAVVWVMMLVAWGFAIRMNREPFQDLVAWIRRRRAHRQATNDAP